MMLARTPKTLAQLIKNSISSLKSRGAKLGSHLAYAVQPSMLPKTALTGLGNVFFLHSQDQHSRERSGKYCHERNPNWMQKK
jgi:hypothetical protein